MRKIFALYPLLIGMQCWGMANIKLEEVLEKVQLEEISLIVPLVMRWLNTQELDPSEKLALKIVKNIIDNPQKKPFYIEEIIMCNFLEPKISEWRNAMDKDAQKTLFQEIFTHLVTTIDAEEMEIYVNDIKNNSNTYENPTYLKKIIQHYSLFNESIP